jgi:hypothetical protein
LGGVWFDLCFLDMLHPCAHAGFVKVSRLRYTLNDLLACPRVFLPKFG